MHLSFGTEVIYDGAQFQTGKNDKVGIVGVNGAGKTTLFRVILGQVELDSGFVSAAGARVGYLPQVLSFDDLGKTVWDYLFDARPWWRGRSHGWRMRRKNRWSSISIFRFV